MGPNWAHLVRFIGEEDGQTHLGEVDPNKYPDVGIAILNGERVAVKLIKGSIFDGRVTDTTMHIARLLAPIGIEEVPIIRCMGLNYRDHAKEANMPIPDVPVVFIKPRTALNGPHPAKINVPKIAQDGSSDYEAELSIILSKTGRDIPESEAMDSRTASGPFQKALTDLVHWARSLCLPPPSAPRIICKLELSIMAMWCKTQTLGPGIGAMRNPKIVLKHGDDMRVEIEKIGTLINEVYYE
ncbi:hypothetical protein AO1008_10926 [Aspergillus oryzae 100-8]|uniref:Fumarylacetoacetase-like C-terminal domain-containing protein n=1 Tax=Aspergillus oryzae (strain 3.042) TaxID=1160506 RepID=I8U7U2_ASPO3|nr:hypothetical protein Ao3042_11920 [Aspergillus oryzae 3.042]KDE84314.1 hypothetical protein AO1008_10926 [Aspergillus oryzae 100-8]|eukprot:EIT82828.1 hypothetical protein Ao3042_11920 [Aspergillus oryzae 3.042]